MSAVGEDLLSEQLIAQILQNDQLLLESFKQAERLQLDYVVAASDGAQDDDDAPMNISETPRFTSPESDGDLASEFYLADALVSTDAAYAQSVQNAAQVAITADWQYAQKIAAAERLAFV